MLLFIVVKHIMHAKVCKQRILTMSGVLPRNRPTSGAGSGSSNVVNGLLICSQLQVNGNANVSGTLQTTGLITNVTGLNVSPGGNGVDVSSAGTLKLGATTSTAVTLGNAG